MWVYECAHCKRAFKGSEVQIDHIVPTGRLLSFEDIPVFLESLLREDVIEYQLLCKPCHQIKTNFEREGQKK